MGTSAAMSTGRRINLTAEARRAEALEQISPRSALRTRRKAKMIAADFRSGPGGPKRLMHMDRRASDNQGRQGEIVAAQRAVDGQAQVVGGQFGCHARDQ